VHEEVLPESESPTKFSVSQLALKVPQHHKQHQTMSAFQSHLAICLTQHQPDKFPGKVHWASTDQAKGTFFVSCGCLHPTLIPELA